MAMSMYHTREKIHDMMVRKEPVQALITATDRVDGHMVWVMSLHHLPNVLALCPAEWSGVPEAQMPAWVGLPVRVLIQEHDRDNNIVICSRTAHISEAQSQLKQSLVKGDVIPAVVSGFLPRSETTPSRLLVEIGGTPIEIPRKQAARAMTQPLASQYYIGQHVSVRVLNPETLDLEVVRPDPWQTYSFTRGQVISGTIARISDGIVFVEPDASPGMVGIAPYPVRGEVKRGDRVQCIVAMFDREKRKLHLRLRRVL